jgi:hypothetical protein
MLKRFVAPVVLHFFVQTTPGSNKTERRHFQSTLSLSLSPHTPAVCACEYISNSNIKSNLLIMNASR